MATWDHRAGTGNAAYQLYLYVDEYSVGGGGNGTSWVNWELGIIKVGSSGGFASSDGAVEWEVHMYGYNNGDRSGTSAFSIGANEAIGTRKVLASQAGWTFAHDPAGTGVLTLNTMARATFANSIGSPQIGWGNVGFTTYYRTGAAPAAPILKTRVSDTALTLTFYDSGDWGTGNTVGPSHNADKATQSNFSDISSTSYPTTAGGAAHDVAYTGLPAYTTHYFRGALRSRDGVWVQSGVLTVYSRPSKAPVPDVTSKTPTSIQLSAAPSSYQGGGFTARETEIWNNAQTTKLATVTDMGNPLFTDLTRVTTYKIRTRLQNSVGWSDWSNWLTVATPGTVPSAPSGYSVYDIAATSFKVSLGSISDNGGAVPSQARVKVSTTASDTGLIKTVTSPQWAPIRVDGLTENTQYYVAEAAYNTAEGGGWGAYGAWVPVTTKNTVPNAPTLSLLSAAGNNATLQWVAPSDLNGAVIVSYKLLVGTNQSLTTGTQEFTTSSLSQVVTGLTPATQYYASVWTETDKGLGSSSPVLAFSTTGGGGSTSGLWLDIAGVPTFCEVWFSGDDGIPKLCEVWHSAGDGVPKVCTS